MKVFLLLMVIAIASCNAQENMEKKQVNKNKMNVGWHYEGGRVHFEMSAPTDGWVTIGFNDGGIAGSYLLMGRVKNGRAEVVEHYTHSAGKYEPIENLTKNVKVQNVSGEEKGRSTRISFSIPIKSSDKYRRDLPEGSSQNLLIAYSQEDDFQHHSIMRTAIKIKL